MTQTIDASRVANNRFLGKTRGPGALPRPTAADPRPVGFGGSLEEAQRAWDDAEAWAADNDRIREERLAKLEADKAAKQRERDGREAARRTAERDQLVARLRGDFLRQPGATEADWERNEQAVIDDHFRREMAAGEEAARREHAKAYQG